MTSVEEDAKTILDQWVTDQEAVDGLPEPLTDEYGNPLLRCKVFVGDSDTPAATAEYTTA